MAEVDISQGFKRVDKAAQVFPKYRELKDSQKKLKKKASDSFDKSEKYLKNNIYRVCQDQQKNKLIYLRTQCCL